jgi:hypothetical protein
MSTPHILPDMSLSSPLVSSSIQTTPLEPLSWQTPELLSLKKDYWNNDYSEELPRLPDPHRQYNGSYADFYRKNGYIGKASQDPSKLIDDATHPIFQKSNWITGYNSFDQWYDEFAQPALALASKFITDPHMLSRWLHLRYGKPAFQNGWVGIQEDPDQVPPDALEDIKNELERIAGKVKFTFLPHYDMEGAIGWWDSDLRGLRRILHARASQAGYRYPEGLWHNPWDTTPQHAIIIDEKFYHQCFAEGTYDSGQRLEHQLHLAITLVHELGHLCVQEWRPEICGDHEPLIHINDGFPEAGNSWRASRLGAICKGMNTAAL